MKSSIHTCALTFTVVLAASLALAQSPAPAPPADAATVAKEAKAREELLKQLGAQHSGVGQIGSRAEIEVPAGYTFFPPRGTQQLLKMWGNLVGGDEEGLLMHEGKGWSVVFEFDDVGYVKDDEKSELNADKMLKQMQDAEPELNKARKEAGLPPQHTVGFAMPPTYNERTHNLEWAIRFTVDGEQGEFLNYHTKLLGRNGVMTATLMVEPSELQAVLPDYQKALAAYKFKGGETYAEYRKGDKVATYGLIGLVAGGAALAAGKAGIFSKLGVIIAKGGKVLILGVVAFFAAIAKFFSRLSGRREDTMREQ